MTYERIDHLEHSVKYLEIRNLNPSVFLDDIKGLCFFYLYKLFLKIFQVYFLVKVSEVTKYGSLFI